MCRSCHEERTRERKTYTPARICICTNDDTSLHVFQHTASISVRATHMRPGALPLVPNRLPRQAQQPHPHIHSWEQLLGRPMRAFPRNASPALLPTDPDCLVPQSSMRVHAHSCVYACPVHPCAFTHLRVCACACAWWYMHAATIAIAGLRTIAVVCASLTYAAHCCAGGCTPDGLARVQ